ncbi:MAG: hypothetical protein KF690_09900 [Bacteroidetes bacterium]|nr:hypothetical protein [Bacteroidota bacterium]
MPALFKALAVILVLSVFSCKNQYLTGKMSYDEFIRRCEWKDITGSKTKPRLPAYMDSLRTVQDSFDMKLVLGTWCNDSRRWVRHFFRLKPQLPLRQLEILGVDTTKRDPYGYHTRYGYDSIPVFLFFRDGREIGRIKVKPRKPKRSLERDMYHILK